MENIDNSKCGVWIDIFPLDYDSKKISINLKLRKFLIFSITLSLRKREFKLKYFEFSKRYIPLLMIFGLIPKKQLKFIQTKLMIYKNDNNNIKYLVNFSSTYNIDKEVYPIEWFKQYTKIQFEDTELITFKEYDPYLTQLYGSYMEMPPIEKRKGHNICNFDNVII